jgi:5-methylcytosine-specific restriction endonuclease McrA
MIRLPTLPRPVELIDKVRKKLTAQYKADHEKTVWDKTYIKAALLEMSAGKCCYCECKLGEESKYLEVEHFHPKTLYPDEVVVWENLLPACKRCNASKRDHDTKEEPIIHPVRDNPQLHLFLKNYRLYHKTKLGQMTIAVIYLNERDRLVTPRFNIGERLIEKLDDLLEMTYKYRSGQKNSTKDLSRIVGTLRGLMLEGTRTYEYSATAATILLNEDSYLQIKRWFIKRNLWNEEFMQLEKDVEFCALK